MMVAISNTVPQQIPPNFNDKGFLINYLLRIIIIPVYNRKCLQMINRLGFN